MIEMGILVLLAFVVLALLRVPVFIALALPAMVYTLLYMNQPISFPVQRILRTVDSFTLLAVPLFIYVGTLMNQGDITDRIFKFADDVVGHLTGGIAQVNIFTSLIFSGISGSALADIGGIGKVLIHTMTDYGYSKGFSAALTSASATLGPLFPPSIPLIMFGIIAEVSVLSLLLAGALPAIVIGIFLMSGTAVIAYIRDFPTESTRSPISEIARSFLIALPALLTPVVLIGGMLGGYFGPTEAAGVTVAYILFINTFIYRVTNFRYVWDAALETARTSGVILLILGAAGLFAWVLSAEGVDQQFAELVFSLSDTPEVVMLLVIIMLLVLGLFLDPLAALVMVAPIVTPTLVQVGYNPVHIGIVTVYALMIGLITPPLGLSTFLAADIAKTSVSDVFSASVPFYLILLTSLFVIAFVPDISLYILRFV